MKKSCIHTMLISFLVLTVCSLATAQIWYVKSDAAGAGTGQSWQDAFTDLQQAILLAPEGDTICVSAGIYRPSVPFAGDSPRHATFYINKAVRLFGGFPGNPGTEGDFEVRDFEHSASILSGDLGVAGDTTDNAFHVVYIDHVSDTMRLDGFVIRDGNGFDGAGFEALGSGIFNNAEGGRSHPQIWNCTIRDNSARENGGGVFNYAAMGGITYPVFGQCRFIRNEGSGGGAYAGYVDDEGEEISRFISCRFVANTARTAQGGAINLVAHSSQSAPEFYNCIFTGNHSPSSSAIDLFVTGTGKTSPVFVNSAIVGNAIGGIRISDIGLGTSTCIIRNSIIWNNGFGQGISVNGGTTDAAFSIIPFGFPGENVLGIDPLFIHTPTHEGTPHELGDLHVHLGSPVVDAGRNADVPSFITTDADGLPRFVDPSVGGMPAGIVDIGPYELQELPVSTSSAVQSSTWNIYPNPTSDILNMDLPLDGSVTEMRLYHSNGSLIARKQYGHGEIKDVISIANLPAGVYKMTMYQGRITETKRIIKL